jgi:ribosomal protein L37AE/L43A
MTTKKHFKRRVRSRAAQTGEPYATALRKIRQQQENRMPENTAPATEIIVYCSFCGKPNTAVARLVAGPGVYICNECVELSVAVVAEAAYTSSEEFSRRLSQYHDRSAEDILAMLPALVRSADRVQSELTGWISRLRERGTDWPTIASAAGVSTEAARQRFEAASAE